MTKTSSDSPQRAALYVRVSTGKQAAKDLSLPDQQRQLREYAERKGMEVVRVYEEPGASARDDRRPVFQEMVADALAKERPFDVVLVLTTSRFFRDATLARIYKRKLAKRGIRVVASFQETSDDPMGELVEGIFELIDQHESTMTGYHTARAMRENARRGHLNHRPKYGFDAEVITDEKGNRKKRPVINEAEAQVIRRMYELASAGQGVLKIAEALRAEGKVQRSGKAWNKQAVLDCLRDPANKGNYTVNLHRKGGGLRPEDERIVIPVEPIVLPALWDRVTAFLSSRSPVVINPAVVGSPMLLTGLLECGKCGAAMTLETGRSGKFRYYNCRRRLREGTATCAGTRLRAEHLEHSLLGHLQHQLFTPERVRKMLEGLAQSMAGLATELHRQRKALEAERRGIEDRLRRQYEFIETGDGDKELVADRLRELRSRLAQVDAQLAKLGQPESLPAIAVDDVAVERFTDQLEQLFMAEDRTFARRYLQLLLDKVVVDGKLIHVHARAAGVMQVAVEKQKADKVVTPSALVPTAAMSRLRLTGSNRRHGG